MKTPKFVTKFMSPENKITDRKLLWFMISISIVALACIMALIFWLCGLGPMNLGIDFTGGTVLELKFGTDMTDDNYNALKKMTTDTLDEYKLSYSAPQKTGSDDTAAISVRFSNTIGNSSASDEEMKDVRDNLMQSLRTKLGQQFPDWEDARIESALTFDSVSASASTTVWLNALFCVLIAAVLILIYIAIRFKWDTGVVAVISLLHDVVIMIAFVVIFHWPVNAPFIAAMITIIGYSINNTIVIFDRVRENSKKATLAELTPAQMADLSIKQTMTRSINTSVTTLVTIVILFILGVSSIREFALPIIIGLIAGTYSSIFVAPSLWVVFRNRKLNKKKKDQFPPAKIEKMEKAK